MEFTLNDYRSPANKLVKEVQDYCRQIVKEPDKLGIEDFYAFEDRVWAFINEIKSKHPRCNPNDLKTEVYQFMTNLNEWSFTISHKSDNILHTVCLHAKY